MPDPSPAPHRRYRALGGILLIVLVAIGVVIARRIAALGDVLGVVVDAPPGRIVVAGSDRGDGRVQWIAAGSEGHLVLVPAAVAAADGWEGIAERLLPGHRVAAIERPTETRQSLGTGAGAREVLAVRALLVIEGPDGGVAPALGIGTGLIRPGDPDATVARTIVQLARGDGGFERIDALPLFHDRSSLIDRLRGSPGHVVRFGLEVVTEGIPASPERGAGEPAAPASAGAPEAPRRNAPVPLDDEEARRAIEKLREQRPERGVIPKPPPSEPPPPDPGRASAERVRLPGPRLAGEEALTGSAGLRPAHPISSPGGSRAGR